MSTEEKDELYDQAVEIAKEVGHDGRVVTLSPLQRRLLIGYNRAYRMLLQMTADGILTAPDHEGYRRLANPDTDKKYVIVSITDTFRNPKHPAKYISFYRPNSNGYAWTLPWAGRYTADDINKHVGYFHNLTDTIAVPLQLIESLAEEPERGDIDGDVGPVVWNNDINWMIINSCKVPFDRLAGTAVVYLQQVGRAKRIPDTGKNKLIAETSADIVRSKSTGSTTDAPETKPSHMLKIEAVQQIGRVLRTEVIVIPAHDGTPSITKEMKQECMGEFYIATTQDCPECADPQEPDQNCTTCMGVGNNERRYMIDWITIKDIYRKMATVAARGTQCRHLEAEEYDVPLPEGKCERRIRCRECGHPMTLIGCHPEPKETK